jgi:hypothetical protein
VGLIILKTPPLTALAGGGSSVLDSGGLIDIICLDWADAGGVKPTMVHIKTDKITAAMNIFFIFHLL